ncbi:MAG: hypothetical protein L0191_17365, partial [Acidobacteria bacterium]|nr:hypothetical protein [Acidobacteriota bacterium]
EYQDRDSADGKVTVVALSDPALQDKYGLCANWEILSTTEILERFAKGTPVMGYTGPHDTRDDVADCADAAWAAPGKDP